MFFLYFLNFNLSTCNVNNNDCDSNCENNNIIYKSLMHCFKPDLQIISTIYYPLEKSSNVALIRLRLRPLL